LLCHLYRALLVPYIAAPTVRCIVGAIHCCVICRCTVGAVHCCVIYTVHCWCHTLLCHLYGALLVPYIAVPSVRCIVGAVHCCVICTANCWCRILLCHLYGALLVPYISPIFTVQCGCHTLLCHLDVPWS
jgi:hypothetical protein